MARVTLAMASSSMTRCGFLLSSAITRGTALGSGPLKTFRFPAPGVVRFATTSGFDAEGFVFMETGTLALSATFTSGDLFEADCPTAAEELGGAGGADGGLVSPADILRSVAPRTSRAWEDFRGAHSALDR